MRLTDKSGPEEKIDGDDLKIGVILDVGVAIVELIHL